MGYGILFFGYILAFFFNSSSVYFFADVIGASIMMFALNKLASYDKGYFHALLADLLYLALCLANGIMIMFSLRDVAALTTAIAVARVAVIVLFHVFFLLATARMCNRAELPNYAAKAKKNLILTAVYCVLDVVVTLMGDSLAEARQTVVIVTVVVGIIWLVSNSYLIVRCFMLICEEGDEAAEPKKSKSKLVNSIMDKVDALGDKIESNKREEAETKKKKRKK